MTERMRKASRFAGLQCVSTTSEIADAHERGYPILVVRVDRVSSDKQVKAELKKQLAQGEFLSVCVHDAFPAGIKQVEPEWAIQRPRKARKPKGGDAARAAATDQANQ